MAKFYNAQLIVTYRCNSRCKICNIWQKKNHENPVKPEVYSKIPPHTKVVDIVDITGGEPFLRQDLKEIVDNVRNRCPNARIVICSNGLAVSHIAKQTEKLLQVTDQIEVGISIDGVQKTNDEIRGVKNGFYKATQTIQELKKIGVRKINLLYTASDSNISELMKVYHLSRELECEFSLAVAHNSDVYYDTRFNKISNIDELKNQLNLLIDKELRSSDVKRWFRAYFAYGAYLFVAKKKRILPCKAGITYFSVHPDGKITPSNLSSTILGNINELDDIERHLSRPEIRKLALQETETRNSWMVCTVRPEMHENLGRIGLWILKNKFLNFSNQYL